MTPYAASSTDLSSNMTPESNDDDNKAQNEDEVEDVNVETSFISFADFSEEYDNETDYAESMSESVANTQFSDRIKTFNASFLNVLLIDRPVFASL